MARRAVLRARRGTAAMAKREPRWQKDSEDRERQASGEIMTGCRHRPGREGGVEAGRAHLRGPARRAGKPVCLAELSGALRDKHDEGRATS